MPAHQDIQSTEARRGRGQREEVKGDKAKEEGEEDEKDDGRVLVVCTEASTCHQLADYLDRGVILTITILKQPQSAITITRPSRFCAIVFVSSSSGSDCTHGLMGSTPSLRATHCMRMLHPRILIRMKLSCFARSHTSSLFILYCLTAPLQ